MGFFKRNRLEIIVFLGILTLFFVSRLISILSLPIFTDEAIYLRWSQIAKQDAAWRFIALTDGKGPPFVWLTMIIMKFVSEPLLAGRLVSVGAGVFTTIGMFFLGREVFKNKWIGILSSFLYVIFPMSLVYDRMALYDSLMAMFAVWSLYFEILLIRLMRLDVALILGMIIGGSVLTKTNGFISLYLLPASLLLFNFKEKERFRTLVKWVGLAMVVVVLTYMYYSILRLSPFFRIIAEKNALFVYPLHEWLQHPFRFLYGNARGEWDWLWRYMTIPFLALVPAAFILNKKNIQEKTLLIIWFLVPAVALAILGRVLYPRFIFPMIMSLIPLAAYSLYELSHIFKTRSLSYLLSFAILFFALRSDVLILKDLSHAPIPESDLRQYYTDWPSGVGIREAVAFFEKEAQKGPIYVATQGTFGLMPFAFEIYLIQNPNIKIVGQWPIESEIPKEVAAVAKKMPTYFVFYQPCNSCPKIGLAPKTWKVEKVLQLEKPIPNRFFTIYKVMQ